MFDLILFFYLHLFVVGLSRVLLDNNNNNQKYSSSSIIIIDSTVSEIQQQPLTRPNQEKNSNESTLQEGSLIECTPVYNDEVSEQKDSIISNQYFLEKEEVGTIAIERSLLPQGDESDEACIHIIQTRSEQDLSQLNLLEILVNDDNHLEDVDCKEQQRLVVVENIMALLESKKAKTAFFKMVEQASVLQCTYRMNRIRCNFLALRKDTLLIQTWYTRTHFNNLQSTAQKLQSLQKASRVRAALSHDMDNIQWIESKIRGELERKKLLQFKLGVEIMFQFMVAHMNRQVIKRKTALAVNIQSLYRQHHSTRYLSKVIATLSLLQCNAKRKLICDDKKQLVTSVLPRIQASMHGHLTRQNLMLLPSKISIITALGKSLVAQEKKIHDVKKIEFLQAVCKASLGKTFFYSSRTRLIPIIQSAIFGHLTRLKREALHSAVLSTQSAYRGFSFRKKLTQDLFHIQTYQARIRRHVEKERASTLTRSLTTIQAALHGSSARHRIIQLCEFSLRLQSWFRSRTCQHYRSNDINSLLILQSIIRSFFERNKLANSLKVISQATTFCHGAATRKISKEKLAACNMLVSQSKRYIEAKNMKLELERILTIQSLCRSWDCISQKIKSMEAIRMVQRVAFSLQIQQLLKNNKAHVLQMQAVVRSFLARRSCQHAIRERTATIVNATIQGRSCRATFFQSTESIQVIQALLRGTVVRESFMSVNNISQVLSAISARIRLQNEFYRNVERLVLGQAMMQQCLASSRRQKALLSIEQIQSLSRTALEKRLKHITLQKIVLIQSRIRSAQTIKIFKDLKEKTDLLQSVVESVLTRNRCHTSMHKLLALQALISCAVARKRLLSRKEEHEHHKTITPFIQSTIRGLTARRNRDTIGKQILLIQGVVRGYLWRKNSLLYIPNTNLEVAPISITSMLDTMNKLFDEEEDSDELDSSDSPNLNVEAPKAVSLSTKVESAMTPKVDIYDFSKNMDSGFGGSKKIVQLIRDRLNNKSNLLDLSGLCIESLPNIPFECDHITELDLSGNLLVTLPEWFCEKFKNVKKLNLSSNRFFDANRILSENLIPLSHTLTHLDLSKNRFEYFEYIPDDEEYDVFSSSFQELQYLNLSHNQLLNISGEIFELISNHKLESLDLSHNQLMTFPTVSASDLLKKWKGFKFINLEHNSFLQSEVGKILYMFKKRPDILKLLKVQLTKRGAQQFHDESETAKKPVETVSIDAGDYFSSSLFDDDYQDDSQPLTDLTELAYHNRFKTHMSTMTFNNNSATDRTYAEYDSDEDESLLTDHSFYHSHTSGFADPNSPKLLSVASSNQPTSPSSATTMNDSSLDYSPCLSDREFATPTQLTVETADEDGEESPLPKLTVDHILEDTSTDLSVNTSNDNVPLAIHITTPTSNQPKLSFIQDLNLPHVTSTTTPDSPPNEETKPKIPKLNLAISPLPTIANQPIAFEKEVQFFSSRSTTSDPMSSPSVPSPANDSENLVSVLNNENIRKSFKIFCKSEFSVESIDFYEAVCAFKQLKDTTLIRNTSQHIFNTFIDPFGIHSLNINSKQVESVKNLVMENGNVKENISTDVFDPILQLVKMNLLDPFKRFQLSDDYKLYEEQMKTPKTARGTPLPRKLTTRHPLLRNGEEQKRLSTKRKKIPFPDMPSRPPLPEERKSVNQISVTLPERKSINVKQMKERINNLMEILHSERRYLEFLIDLWEMYYIPLVENRYIKGTEQPASKRKSKGHTDEAQQPLKRKLSFVDKLFNKNKHNPNSHDDNRIVSKEDAQEMFPKNLFSIITFNKGFLVKLEERFALYSNDEDNTAILPRMYNMIIGDIFIKSIPYFRLYDNYLESYENAMNKIRQVRAQNKEFDRWIKKRKSHPRSRNLEIHSFLVCPVQRIVRYKLLIENLLKTTEEDHPDFFPLTKSLEMVIDMANQQNISIKLTNNRVKVRMLTQLFDLYEQLGCSLTQSGAVVEDNLLVREGDVEISISKEESTSPKKNKKSQRAYLFSNVLVLIEKTKIVDKQISSDNTTNPNGGSQGETHSQDEPLKRSSSFWKKKKESQEQTSPKVHKAIKVEKKHVRLEDAFISGGSSNTIEISFTVGSKLTSVASESDLKGSHSPSAISTDTLSASHLVTMSGLFSARKHSKSTDNIPSNSTTSLDSARKRSTSLFEKLTSKYKLRQKETKLTMVLTFGSSELKNQWLTDLEQAIKQAKLKQLSKASKLSASSSFII
ncbi:hypothetical protein C9374_004815 [Naegleria lovaniensis]|uniref:DH domain-containing protein n=1 Tax=Naegleria lovaniensis TaxID=51637 RepID=A0AA88KKD0_NAELO|nr:uncharacterized protein C9374_004815 [Naegleria lovaniensis]KAG2382848.1 hypothetical protein C9374_004815 [Naegleria lovaniensis]